MTRTSAAGLISTAIALAAMAADHLLDEDGGLADPAAFLLSAVAVVGTTAVLFGVVVPRAERDADRAATFGLACGIVALVSLPLALWLGVPIVLGGAAASLGDAGRSGARRGRAAAAMIVGAAVVALGAAAYAYVALDKLA